MTHALASASLLLFLAGGNPGIPGLVAPPDQTTVGWAAESQPVVFTWNAAVAATNYRLRISTSEDFKHLVVDRTTAKTSETVRGLETGKYYWKVTVVDGGGNDVSFSATARFAIQ